MLTPPFFHWNKGLEPPLVGVAVQVTDVPAQTPLADATIDKDTGKTGLTVMVTKFDMAGLAAQTLLE